ncbi:MAG: deoxyhypusine synthase [Candidatus Verstraetearchaeota archaeon]|nr:deoxyhypusine synthase [Candidatus Verstraetearchaeota archaeon]
MSGRHSGSKIGKRREIRDSLIADKVKDLFVDGRMDIVTLVQGFSKMGGFMAPHLAKASEILKEMTAGGTTVFLSFTGNVVSTGLRGVIAQMVRKGLVNAIVTTCGALDHDLARAYGGRYSCGEFEYDDVMLNELEIHRLGNVLIPLEDYGPLIEKVMRRELPEIMRGRDSISPSELASEFGGRIKDENSILRAACEMKVPVYVPGIIDGSFGTNLFFYAQTNKIRLDLFKDMNSILNTVYDSRKTGGVIIGGGISKHHVIWWNQFKEGLDYCVYLTTAQEYDGSLSGALPREAISWGKVKPKARHVAVIGDVTITLPLIVGAVL